MIVFAPNKTTSLWILLSCMPIAAQSSKRFLFIFVPELMHSAMVTAVDDVVGAVVTALTALTDAGMMDNTIHDPGLPLGQRHDLKNGWIRKSVNYSFIIFKYELICFIVLRVYF